MSRRQEETTPLMGGGGGGGDKYYFLNKQPGSEKAEVIESVPKGTSEDEFAPRILSDSVRACVAHTHTHTRVV
jgi:hypothetical protein